MSTQKLPFYVNVYKQVSLQVLGSSWYDQPSEATQEELQFKPYATGNC